MWSFNTKNNLRRLKAKPPIVLVTSADTKDANAQQSAAAIAIK